MVKDIVLIFQTLGHEKQKLKLETEIQYHPITIYVLSMDSIRIIVPEESFFFINLFVRTCIDESCRASFQLAQSLKIKQFRNKNCLWQLCSMADQKEMSIFFLLSMEKVQIYFKRTSDLWWDTRAKNAHSKVKINS